MLCGRCVRSATKAKKKVITEQNKIECVNPLCARRLSVVGIQKVLIKSISGILCASAPNNIALLPTLLPSKASPIHAPSAMCVSVSTNKNNLSSRYVFLVLYNTILKIMPISLIITASSFSNKT